MGALIPLQCHACTEKNNTTVDFKTKSFEKFIPHAGSLWSWANWIVPYQVANPEFMSTCLCINSACGVIFRGVCSLHFYILKLLSCLGPYFKQFETLSKFWAWSESRLFANAFSGVTTSGDSWSKRRTISKQTTGILSGRTCRVGGHDAWKYTLHMKNCQTPNTWPLSVFFPFSGLQEYHCQ